MDFKRDGSYQEVMG